MDHVATAVPPTVPSARRSETRQRSRAIALRCTESEYAAIAAAAIRSGLSVGAFLRGQALGTPGPRAVRVPHPDRQLLARVLSAIGSLGSNVNQLARIANTMGELPAAAELAAAQAAIMEIRGILFRALGRGD